MKTMTIQEIRDDFNLGPIHPQGAQAWSGPNATPARLAYRARMRCWVLRILRGSGGMPVYCEPGSSRMGVVADLLEIPALADIASRVQAVQAALQEALEAAHANTSAQYPTPAVDDCAMLHTINWLAESAGLDPIEREIFEFTAAVRTFRPLRLALSTWGELGQAELPQAFSGILNRPMQAVAPALQRNSRLMGCGLVSLYGHGDIVLDRLLKVPRVLGQRIATHEDHPALILSYLVEPMVAPRLDLEDFRYMQASTQLALSWLLGALQATKIQRTPHGTHLLVSGVPGLGKTEWVKAVLAHCGATRTVTAMELVVLDSNGTALSGEERLAHLRMSLSMLRNQEGCVLVFDEADDVFRAAGESDSGGGDPSAVTMANHRASLNRLIEDSRIPVIWIMNHPDILDPAVLRRFDTVIAFEGMPRSVRLDLLQRRLGGSASATELARWADIARLTPALVDRLAVVVKRAQAAGQPMDANDCCHWLRNRLPGKETSRLKRRTRGSPNSNGSSNSSTGPATTEWDAEAVQASENLLAIAEGIGRCGSARLLLYGEPGTGKTAFAHALAKLLDKPLQEKRASDLLSPWVGETEQRINQAFESAIADDAVLFIDEVDSLLASREHAVRNWEVSQVNELLEQLSDFDGIVVLATNRLDALDQAVLRRMDAKIRFDVLNPHQLRTHFMRLCQSIGAVPQESQCQSVRSLKGLTPGDFACVQRRLAFAPIEGDDDKASVLLNLLREELRLKTKGAKPIGFYQSELELQDEEEDKADPDDGVISL
jgi:SpoVK/Ycf46/Vps4 family AAA+-type ATPase